MKTLLSKSLFTLCTVILSFASFSQTTPSREVLVEDTIYHFQKAYDLTQKLIDSTTVSSYSLADQDAFRMFMKDKTHSLFMSTYQSMLSGVINSTHLQGAYDDRFNSLKNSATLLSEFSTWKLAHASHNNHGHSHGAEAGNCSNVDFELGTYQHWLPSTGDVNCPAGHPTGCVQNITAGTMGTGLGAQHTVVTGGFDQDVGVLPRLNPNGGSFSVMLGDQDGGREVSIITHTASITADKPYFTYDFAVVFWDPSHPQNEQPWFNVEFLDSTGAQIPSCGNYFVITGGNVPGFINHTTPQWRYKPWSRITVDLSTYVGQDITVRFSVADCGYGAHDGRAYIDGSCFLPQIKKTQDCKGILLEADSNYLSYQWYGGTPLAPLAGDTNQTLYIPGPGIYGVELISESQCTLFIDTLINDIYITLNQTITQVDPSCIGVNDGSLTFNAYGGQAPYTYSIDGGVTTDTTTTFSGLAPGTYTCIVYDSGGCSDTLTYNLTNPPNILPNLILNDAQCFSECNGEVTAVPSGGTSPGGTYRVEFNNNFSITKSRDNLCAGAHTVKVTDEKGCFTITPFVIGQPVPEVIDAIVVRDEQCFNACDGTITINDATAAEYSIDNGMTWQSSNIFNNLCSQAGPYQVAIRTANGCEGRAIEILNQPPPLVMPELLDTFVCLNKNAIYNAVALGGTPPYSFSWSNGQTGPTMIESPAVPTDYTVTVTDANGCSFTNEFTINLHPQPNANFTFDPGPETDVFNVKVDFTNTTDYGAPLQYEWYIDQFATETTRDAFYEFPATGGLSYTNCLKVENTQGCRDSICKVLSIKYEVLLFAPNTFTPNDDNVNEVFLPIVEGLRTEDYQFLVFNRWGELMFSTTSQTEGWDGTYKGNKVEEDAYIWRVVGITKQTGEDFEKFGHITVLNKL